MSVKSKKLYKRIRVGREVYMIEEDYGNCPRLIRSKVKSKSINYYGEITLTTSKDEYYLSSPEVKVFTSKKAANETYIKRLEEFKNGMLKERKQIEYNLSRNQRKLDEVDWRIDKANS